MGGNFLELPNVVMFLIVLDVMHYLIVCIYFLILVVVDRASEFLVFRLFCQCGVIFFDLFNYCVVDRHHLVVSGMFVL